MGFDSADRHSDDPGGSDQKNGCLAEKFFAKHIVGFRFLTKVIKQSFNITNFDSFKLIYADIYRK